MTDEKTNTLDAELDAWLRPLIEDASGKLGEMGLFDDPLMDIKPAWALPQQVLIGKVRAHGNPARFRWFICGEMPLDHIGDEVATSPREAARHFSLKWQLDATRLGGDAADTLAQQAEALYALVEDDTLWSKDQGEPAH